MKCKITKEEALQHNDLYDILTGDYEIIRNEHRRGSTFFREMVQEITEEDCLEWNIPIEYVGLWKSNEFVWAEDYHDESDMFPFKKVVKETKEVVLVETFYTEVKPEDYES